MSSVLIPASDAVRDFAAFVITGDRDNFSVGANLMQLLLVAQEGEWDEVAPVIRGFQQMTAAIKFCPRPVVVAPFGLTLGGGTEICLHAARRQPHAETYIGLVESGVGLIPGGGGTKEMLLRAVDAAAALAPPDPKDPPSRFAQSAEVAEALKRALETIAMAKVSTSAAEARAPWTSHVRRSHYPQPRAPAPGCEGQLPPPGSCRLHRARTAHANSRTWTQRARCA